MDVARFALFCGLVGGVLGVFGFGAFQPGFDARRPVVESVGGVAGDVELFVAVEAGVDEVAGEVFHEGPFAGGVGDDGGDVVFSEEGDEVGGFEGVVADFDGVTEFVIFVDFEICTAFHEGGVLLGEFDGILGVAREFFEEGFETGGIEFEVGRELPEEGGRVFLSLRRACPARRSWREVRRCL